MAGPWRRAVGWAFPSLVGKSAANEVPAAARALSSDSMRGARAPRARGYAMADGGRLLQSWGKSPSSADADLQSGLRALRTRARQLAENDPYGKRYLRLLEKNVIGHDGIGLRSEAVDSRGAFDPVAGAIIEAGWKRFCRRGVCTVDGRHSMAAVDSIVLTSTARDGEMFVELVRGKAAGNPFGLALSLLEADFCDENRNGRTNEGAPVVLGVEYAPGGRPTRYHLFANHPGDSAWRNPRQERRIVPAGSIVHSARFSRASQSRGVTWFAASGVPLHMLAGYREAELVAARIGSSKMGFYKTPSGDEYAGEGQTEAGDVVHEVEPGLFEQLPNDWEIETFDVDHPSTAYGPFTKEVLRGASVGFDVSYNTLGGDLEGVNFSAMRHGAVEERDGWRGIQTWLCEHVKDPIFDAWLEMALLSGELAGLDPSRLDRYRAHKWEPRGWGWVDPLKEAQAHALDLSLSLSTARSVVASRGARLEDVLEQIANERALYASYGLVHPVDIKQSTAKGGPVNEGSEDTEDDADAAGDGSAGDDDDPDASPRSDDPPHRRTRRGGRRRRRHRNE